MYEVVPIGIASLVDCQGLLPAEAHQKIMQSLTSSVTRLIAFAAVDEQKVVGLAAALFTPFLQQTDILHIEVAPDYRNKHIGTTLLAKIQEETVLQGGNILTLVYPQDAPEALAVEKMLAANQWKGIRPFMVICEFDPASFDAPWLHLSYDYPRDYHEFDWKHLTPEEHEALKIRESHEEFSSAFSPCREEETIEFLNSLGVRHKGRVVGWMITHRIDADTIRYSSLYVEPTLHFRGIATKLLAHAILLHVQSPTKKARMEIPFLQVHPSWIKFIKKRLLPYANKVAFLKQGWNTLSYSKKPEK